MELIDQLKGYLSEMFDVSGFDEKTKEAMLQKAMGIWIDNAFSRIYESAGSDFRNKLSNFFAKIKSIDDINLLQEKITVIFSSLSKKERKKMVDIFYDEAASLMEKMIEKFNFGATVKQKEEYMERISKLTKS